MTHNISHKIVFGAFAFLSVSMASPAYSTEINLVDVTSAAGLNNENYGSPTRHSLGVVWLDVNKDGHPDIFATNGFDVSESGALRPHLYMNDGFGKFTLADHLLPDFENYEYVGASAADYDRDGDIDIFVYTANETWGLGPKKKNPYGGPPNLLLKNGFVENGGELTAGLFTDVAKAAGIDGCFADFAKVIEDHDLSLPKPSRHKCSQTRSASFLDFDLDGWIDIYTGQMVANRASAKNPKQDAIGKRANLDIVFRNQRDGTFKALPGVIRAGNATKRAALVARAGHLNDDIWPDVYVGNAAGMHASEEDLTDAVLINNGQGHLDLAHEYIGKDSPAAMGAAFGDINGDGKFDIYITDVPVHLSDEVDPSRSGNTLYMSQQGGFSQNIAKLTQMDFHMSWGANFADFDLDGEIDLFVAAAVPRTETQFGGDSAVFTNMYGLKPKKLDIATTNARGSALADYDGDGDHDLLLVNQDGKLQLFRNDSAHPNAKSFTLEIKAARSNLDAIGLRADVYTKSGKRFSQQITGGNSAHSQDDDKLIFGIGDDVVDWLEIRWPHPDIPKQVIDPVNTDHLIVVEPNAPL